MASSNSYPGWAYLLAGVALGLFIAFLAYLKSLPEQQIPIDKAKTDQHSTPDFDFYTILPELEVVVPDTDVTKGKDNANQSNGKKTEAVSSPEVLRDNEAFVLQVGSFKDAQQADKLKASLALIGLQAHIQKVEVNNYTWHRVRLGPVTDRKALNSIRQRLRENDLRAITLKVSR